MKSLGFASYFTDYCTAALERWKSREPNSALFFAASQKQLQYYNLPCFQTIP